MKSRDAMTGSPGSEEEGAGDGRPQFPLAENEAIMQQVVKEREALEALLVQKQQVSFCVHADLVNFRLIEI